MAEITKKELDEKYNHKDMPKIENYLFNFCGCFMKIFAMTVFGVGAVILAVFVFPFIRLFTLHRKDFGVVARAYVSHTFRVFLGFLNLLQSFLQFPYFDMKPVNKFFVFLYMESLAFL